MRFKYFILFVLKFLLFDNCIYAQEIPVKLWIRQLGTTNNDEFHEVATDGLGNIYVTGYTEGGLDGNKNASERVYF